MSYFSHFNKRTIKCMDVSKCSSRKPAAAATGGSAALWCGAGWGQFDASLWLTSVFIRAIPCLFLSFVIIQATINKTSHQ